MRQWLFRTRSDVMWFVSAGLFALVIFFRQQLRSAFARVFGDRIDGLIEIAHLEHWHNVLRGVSPWDRTLWYFPNPDTVGYNDGYLLYGLAYGFFRVIGADAFVASDLTNMGVKAVGFLGFVLFARRFAGASMPVAAVFALIFTIANASYANAYHAQLFSVGFAPLLAFWIGIAIGNAPHRPGRAAGYGALVAAFYAAWMMTAFYTAWFSPMARLSCCCSWRCSPPLRNGIAPGRGCGDRGGPWGSPGRSSRSVSCRSCMFTGPLPGAPACTIFMRSRVISRP